MCVLQQGLHCFKYSAHSHQAALRGETIQGTLSSSEPFFCTFFSCFTLSLPSVQALWKGLRLTCCPWQPREEDPHKRATFSLQNVWESFLSVVRTQIPHENPWEWVLNILLWAPYSQGTEIGNHALLAEWRHCEFMSCSVVYIFHPQWSWELVRWTWITWMTTWTANSALRKPLMSLALKRMVFLFSPERDLN